MSLQLALSEPVPSPLLTAYFLLKKNIYLAVPSLSCGMQDLVPWLGIEPEPPALEVQSLSQWIPLATFLDHLILVCTVQEAVIEMALEVQAIY